MVSIAPIRSAGCRSCSWTLPSPAASRSSSTRLGPSPQITKAADGRVFTDNGDITFTVPADVDGSMSLLGDALTESGVPDTWAAAGEGNAKSYTMGAGEGGFVDVTSDFGDVALVVQ